MKVLIGCEESQTVCKAFRQLGHEAYSNDLKPCSGGHPKWYADALSKSKEERQAIRSKSFPGIANAIASQWG